MPIPKEIDRISLVKVIPALHSIFLVFVLPEWLYALLGLGLDNLDKQVELRDRQTDRQIYRQIDRQADRQQASLLYHIHNIHDDDYRPF